LARLYCQYYFVFGEQLTSGDSRWVATRPLYPHAPRSTDAETLDGAARDFAGAASAVSEGIQTNRASAAQRRPTILPDVTARYGKPSMCARKLCHRVHRRGGSGRISWHSA